MQPLISVIVPARNVAPWIEPAIRSALNQTVADLEVIVVDDGSTDETAERAAAIVDPRLTVLRLPHRGVSAARNTAVNASSAPYVGFLDGDDMWTPEKLERHLSLLQRRPDLDLTFSWSRIVDQDGEWIGHVHRGAPGLTSFEDLLVKEPIGNGSAVVVRRSALEQAGPFDVSLQAATDHDMWLRIALLRSANAWCIGEPLTLYRRRPGQLTSGWRLQLSETGKVMAKVRTLAPAAATSLFRKAQRVNYRAYAFMAYESGECGAAVGLLAGSVRCGPAAALLDAHTWSMACAIGARTLLPARAFARLRQVYRGR